MTPGIAAFCLALFSIVVVKTFGHRMLKFGASGNQRLKYLLFEITGTARRLEQQLFDNSDAIKALERKLETAQRKKRELTVVISSAKLKSQKLERRAQQSDKRNRKRKTLLQLKRLSQ